MKKPAAKSPKKAKKRKSYANFAAAKGKGSAKSVKKDAKSPATKFPSTKKQLLRRLWTSNLH